MSIRRSLAWTFSEQTLQQLLRLGGTVIIARLLTPDELGIFALALSASAVLTALRAFGVSNYLIREPELTTAKVRSAFGVMLVMSWTLGCLLYFGRHAIAEIYGRPSIAEVMALLSFSFFVAPFGEPATALLTRKMRFRSLHNIGLSATAAGTALSVGLAYAGYSYMALAWGLLTTSCLGALLAMLTNRRYALMLPSFAHWRDVTRFGGLLSLTSLIGTMNSEGVSFIVGGLIGPASLAQFNRAAQVPNVFRQAVFLPIARVLTPAWADRVRGGHSLGPGAQKLVAVNTVLVWPVFLCLSLVAVPFITLVFGVNWRPAGEIFPWVLLAQAIFVALPQPEQVLVPHGRVGRAFLVRAVTAVFSIAVALYTASISLEAFAIGRVVAASFMVAMNFLAIRSIIRIDPWELAWRYLRSAAVALLAAIPAAAYHVTYGDAMTLPELIVVIAACGLLWLLGIAVTRHFVWGELMIFARKAIGS